MAFSMYWSWFDFDVILCFRKEELLHHQLVPLKRKETLHCNSICCWDTRWHTTQKTIYLVISVELVQNFFAAFSSQTPSVHDSSRWFTYTLCSLVDLPIFVCARSQDTSVFNTLKNCRWPSPVPRPRQHQDGDNLNIMYFLSTLFSEVKTFIHKFV